MKILLSSTNVDYLDYLKELLSKNYRNCSFFTAASWEQTLSTAAEVDPDMLIIDVDFSELKLSSTMLSLIRHSNIYTLFIINTKNPEEIEQALKMEANDYVDRYSGEADLIARVKVALLSCKTIRKLDSAENSLSVLTNLISDWDYLINSEGKVLYMSPSCERITGYSQGEFIKEPQLLGSIVHEDDREGFAVQFQSSLQGDNLLYLEFRIINRSGKERWISSLSQPVRDNNGNILYRRVTNRDLTEQRVSEKAWQDEKIDRESEKKYREIAELLPEIVFETDEQYYLTFVNQSAFSIFGYTQDDLDDGLNILQLLHPQYHERAKTNIGKVMAGNKIGSNEYTAQRKDGSTFPIIVQSTPVIRNNKPAGIRGIGINITKLKETEEALQTSEELFRVVFNSANDAFFVHEVDGTIINVNETMLRMYQIETKEEAMKLSIRDDFSTFDNPLEQLPLLWEKAVSGESTVFEWKARRPKDGSVFDVEVFLNRLHLKGKVFVLASVKDITRQKKMSLELRLERDRAQQYLDVAGVVMVALNNEGTITMINKKGCEVLGYEEGEIVGKSWDKFVPLKAQDKIREIFNSFLEGKITKYHESPALTRSGSERFFAWHNSVLRNEEGVITGILASGEDITERKETEAALNQSNSLLKAQQEASLDGILVVNANRETISFNKQLCNIWGLTEMELLNVNSGKRLNYISQKVKVPSPEKFITEIEEIYIERFKTVHDEIVLKDGRVIERYSGPIISQENYYGRVWFFRNITERKQKEVELEAAYNKINEGIRNARRFHESSLPKTLPQMEDIAIAAYYNPAEELGGDYYNIIKIGDQLLFYITDVAGHGLDSAMLTVFIKEAINGFLSFEHKEDRILSPKAILKYLASQYYREGFPEFYYICAFIGVFDLKSYKLRYSSVGFHSPSFAVNENGKIIPLTIQCLPISTVIGPELMNFTEKRITLLPGTTIFLTTDGLVEQMIGNTQYMERLQGIIQKNFFLPPELLVNVINEDFEKFLGALQGDDDITFIAAQVTQKPKDRLTLKTESYIYAIDSVLDELQTFFQKYIEDADYFLMGVNELVNNAIEHGNNFEPQKKVIIDAVVATKYVSVTIEDEGDGFNWQNKINVPFNIFNTNTRSRGIILTKMCFCDHLYYNEQGNRVTLIKKL